MRVDCRAPADVESKDELALGGNRGQDSDAFGVLFHFGY